MAAATRSLRPPLVAATLLGLVVLTGCTSAVEVTVPPLASDPSCVAATRLWPTAVSGHEKVAVSPDSPSVRAWGDPAIIARCGVAAPAPSTDCLTVNDVDWVVTALSDGTKFVTFGRSPAIEVLVPKDYAPEGGQLPVFTGAASALPQTGSHCS